VFLTVFPSIMLPMFLAVMDQTIVATALPGIAASLGNVERISWVVVAYLIATTIAAPVYGQLGDIFGRRRLMFVALIIFMAASILCAAAPNLNVLIAGRVLQGLGGGGLMTLSQALIGETIPPRERARYQGYIATVAVTSNGLGPLAGGFLTQHFGWESIFLVNLPIGVVAFLLTFRLKVQPRPATAWKFDLPGLVLFVLFVAPVLLALQQVQRLDPNSFVAVGAFMALGLVSVGLLIWREKRATSPLLPIPLLRHPSIWRSDALAACHGAALVSLITFMPIYLQVVRGTTPAETGLLFLPLTVGIGVGSMITGRVVAITGRTTIFPSYGLILVTANLLFLAWWAQNLTLLELPIALGWNGLFMGTVMGVVQVTVQSAAGPGTLGAASASVQFSRSVGAAFGTALVAAVLFSVLAVRNPETARLFGEVVERGAGAMASLDAAHKAVFEKEVAGAFRAAFLTIATFTGIGLLLAMSIPMRRLE
jgi:EmrB/QacA subfamily drug resistance transporter